MKKICKITAGILFTFLFSVSLIAQEEEKADIDYQAFFYAVERGDLHEVESTLKAGANIEATYYEEEVTPLIAAAFKCQTEIVEFLVSKGAKIDAADVDGNTALNYLAKYNYTPEDAAIRAKDIASFLISKGADIEIKNNKGATPLSNAARIGNNYMIRFLSNKGANIETKDNQDRRPLHWAVLGDNPNTVKLLLALDAKCCEKDKDGYSPYDYAYRDYNLVIEYILFPEMKWNNPYFNQH